MRGLEARSRWAYVGGRAIAILSFYDLHGATAPRIAEMLNDRGVPTSTGKAWTKDSVHRLYVRAKQAGARSVAMEADQLLRLAEVSEIPALHGGKWWPRNATELWQTVYQLPAVDYTDNGFNWTREELEEACNLSRDLNHGDAYEASAAWLELHAA